MDGHRHQSHWGLLLCCCIFAGTAQCGSGNGNFERTVGRELASLSAPIDDEPLPDGKLAVRLRCGDFCDNQPHASKRMSMQVEAGDDRLDRRLRSGYRQMGERLASKLWDDPAGRRIKFDIEGRPGIGLVIPFD